MNGQMYQIASIVAAAKAALQTDRPITYTHAKYENSIQFVFLPRKKFFQTENYTAPNVPSWFKQLKKNGMQDIKLLCPYFVKDRHVLGFSNTTESSILCFFKNGKVTFFTAHWEFDSERKQWDILYTERAWENPPSEKPHFENNTDSFRKILSDIRDFSYQIEFENFAQIFDSAIRLLDGEKEYPDEKYGLGLPQIPIQNLPIFEAASKADVFGAMGSWNDSPPYAAHKKGLSLEYETLSAELLKNIRLAILYAINEW